VAEIHISSEVKQALADSQPVVALESTVISHGLPRPQNLETALLCESAIRSEGAVPATIGIIDGKLIVGLNSDQLELLANNENIRKVSRRDFGIALALKQHGATTVAGTMIAAHMAGIRVFATGGIGGVHRGDDADISADLPELGRTPVAVVCAGAKSILDLPRTLEYLETVGVPILGYQTDHFPAFYARQSNLPVDQRIDDPEQAAIVIKAHFEMGFGGILVAVPPPEESALDKAEMEGSVYAAIDHAITDGISGKELTPYLLSKVSEITGGGSLKVNIALLEQNARVAAQIAEAL